MKEHIPWYWVNAKTERFLKDGYILEGETVEGRVEQIGLAAEKILGVKGFAVKFIECVANGWFSLASPVWANFGRERGLPISCNSSFIPDTMDGILRKVAEVGMMSKHGSGTSGYFGSLRPRGSDIRDGGKSSGPAHFMELFDTVADVVSQTGVRRGSFAAYLPIEHDDIEEFLQIREDGHPIQRMSLGITVSDAWMNSMIEGNVAKRKIWALVIKKRFESGYPYIMFSDTANRNAPDVYKDKGMTIYSSNLCSEILLPTTENESFVCDLSSMNLLHFLDWKETDAVRTLTYFLDAVMTEYITKSEGIPFMGDACLFAKRHRALGLGVLGWHSFLQSQMIPFESMEAKRLNVTIHKRISEEALAASKEMAGLFGEPEVLKGYGRRNTTLMAIAPTTSSSFILGQVSPSIEPLDSNYFVKDLAKGKFTYKNPYLAKVLRKHDKSDDDTWQNILHHGGSVQHLEFLSQEEKDVFRTFGEISQLEVVIQASQRQKYIDQSQSLNLMIHPNTSAKDVNALLIRAWELGVKTLYYQRGVSPAQALSRSIMSCSSCES